MDHDFRKSSVMAEINMTPMVDVMLVLLIIFMVVTPVLMAGFKAVVIWVSEARRAFANACIMAFGALGVIVATLPTELAIQVVGWRGVFMALQYPVELPGIRDEHEGDDAGWMARWLDRPTWDVRVTPNVVKRTGERPKRKRFR